MTSFELPIAYGFSTSTLFWLTENTNTSGGGMFEQFAQYGFAGAVVGLVIYFLQYFNGRQDVQSKQHHKELEEYKQELTNERADRKREELGYLAQIKQLQDEVTKLKIEYTKLQAELEVIKQMQRER